MRLVPHRRAWKALFARERRRVLSAIGKWVAEIHHVGSTAIPGIPAKPIIDIDTFVRSRADAARVARALTRLGYHYRGEGPRRGMWLAVRGPEWRRTVHFHIISARMRGWYASLLFRDYLLAHRGCAREYGKFKTRLAKRYPDNRGAYTNGKTAFVRAVLRKASRRWPARAFAARYRP